MNYECSVREYEARIMGRSQRSVIEDENNDKCVRVDPKQNRMLHEKFELAESYLARFIANLIQKFTQKRDVLSVRNGCCTDDQ
jgi:hypothetical protein